MTDMHPSRRKRQVGSADDVPYDYSAIKEFKEIAYQIGYIESIEEEERERYYKIFIMKTEHMPSYSLLTIMAKESISLPEIMQNERKIQGVEGIKGYRRSRVNEKLLYNSLDREIKRLKEVLLKTNLCYAEAFEEIVELPDHPHQIIDDLENRLEQIRTETDSDYDYLNAKVTIYDFFNYLVSVRDTNIV